MVSYVKEAGKPTEYYGLSTDTKPTENVGNADLFMEIDTGDVFLFDADGNQWCQVI